MVSIVAICLIKNEEFFVENVLSNIYDFCDKIIVADNYSSDTTFELVKKLSEKNNKIQLVRIKDRTKSQNLIKEYVGTPTWIFGVDGDEIYDPLGLKYLRKMLIEGAYVNVVQIYGNVLNCNFLDDSKTKATGYLAPPCRSMTKLYNFQLIKDWSDPGVERLHGEVIYKDGYSKDNALNLYEQYSWENSPFRCLHLCFLRRSSKDALSANGKLFARTSGVDLSQGGALTKLKRMVFKLFKRSEQSSWKIQKYRRGALVEKTVGLFFQNDLL